MTKYSLKELWEEIFGKEDEVYDYAGRLMLKSACGNPHSSYQPTIDHIRPISKGGKDTKDNIVICHHITNEEKADNFPHWKTKNERYHARKKKGVKNSYEIISDEKERN